MLTDYELSKTFFAGSRKEILIESISLMMTKAGERRIKLGCAMPLCDGKQVGLPGWVGDSLDVIGREDSLETAVKFAVDLKEMSLTVYQTDDSQKPAQLAVAPLLNAFSLRRDPQEYDAEDLSDVNLHFVAYIQATTQLWAWFYGHFRMSCYVKFETTQGELAITPVDDKQMKLGEDDDDAARKDATAKKRDAEFAPA